MTRTEATLFFIVLLLVLIITPVSANTEYKIPGSPVTVGVVSNVTLNITFSTVEPTGSTKIFSDEFNTTWVIPPDKSPYGSFDIIVVPAQSSWFWWFW